MELNNLKPKKGSRHAKKRLGRGPGSGHGKTAGRGEKGQKSRSGYSGKRGFEGGQMPLHRRLPKRGFTNIFKKDFAVVNLSDLERFDNGATVNETSLRQAGLVKGQHDGVKILGDGELSKKLTVTATKFSATARKQIEAAGGTCEETKERA
jgi:large subunit ribosomal protein L15